MSNLSAPFQLLELNVVSAQDLAPVARSLRTYAVAWVDSDRKLSTRVDTEGHNNPTWNDKFVFRVDEEFLNDETSSIMIEVYALHWYKDIHVGTARARISQLIPPPSTKAFHNDRPPPGMRFVALQVRRPSGRPQGILNVGATLLDSSMRSMPLYSRENGTTGQRYNDNNGMEEEEEEYEHDRHDHLDQRHHHFQKPELRRVKSDSSSMVDSELAQPKVVKQRGKTNSMSSSELSLNQNLQKERLMGGPMVRGSEGINQVNENYGNEYISDDSDDDEDGVAVAKGEADESEVTKHRGVAMESEVMDPPIHRRRDSFIDSSEDENEIAGARIDVKKRHMHEKKPSTGTNSSSSRRGTPLHPMASASPQHRMSPAAPRHGKMGTPQHPMSATPRHRLAGMSQRTAVSRTPRHRMSAALTPQHPMSRNPLHEKARMFGTPQHEKAGMFGTPRHEKAMRFASPRHEKAMAFASPRHEKAMAFASQRHEKAMPFASPRHEKAMTFASPRHEKAMMFASPRHEKAGTFASPRHEKAGTARHEKFGTPRHEKLGSTPRHEKLGSTPRHEKLGGTPRHEMAGTPRHEMAVMPRHEIAETHRHEMAGTHRHEMAGTPRHEMAATPRHAMAATPRHAMAGTPMHHRVNSGTPLHPMSGTPLHPMSGTPLHKRSESNQMVGKPGTPVHAMSFTKFPEFEASRRSNSRGGGTTMTDSELGPSPSEVAAAVAKVPIRNDHQNSIGGGWSNDDGTVEGLQAKLDRWKTELPPVYDNGDIASSVSHSNTTSSRSSRKRNGRKKSSGLFSCFSNICGLQCTVVYGEKKKGKEGKGSTAGKTSSEVTSYL